MFNPKTNYFQTRRFSISSAILSQILVQINSTFTKLCQLKSGGPVNICALDISKAFDKMNHHGLFLQLMQKQIPLNLLCILENWFKLCSTCIKWGSVVHGSSVLTVV